LLGVVVQGHGLGVGAAHVDADADASLAHRLIPPTLRALKYFALCLCITLTATGRLFPRSYAVCEVRPKRGAPVKRAVMEGERIPSLYDRGEDIEGGDPL